MFVAKVIGNMVCTHKDDNLKGLKLLIVQPVDVQLNDKGKPLVAIDTIGQSGAGDLVYLAKSRESSLPLNKDLVASDAGILGIIDYYNVTKRMEEL
ncbi:MULTISPECIES: EutN/CcmL family microcompartment protein [Neobacillus]|jgi:ethanolamine utilization protein EutN|uniref:EutN/CcmL family microcompartment protein n=1 Tax=Neobacillus TaxID=2675232 RepID=UPI001409BA77|nr:EutN/CcmL family microcompartment protein [Neobacillus sp. OS1-33]NHC41213.1 EutN/CcmL family microcompartment protein [Bacillus sp. MM2020_1]WML26549.1 EutN/CcmL family microcompartment protein [Neobacillus sp. OS1-33]